MPSPAHGAVPAVILLALTLAPAFAMAASSRTPQVEQTWNILDRCRRQSFEKFPDQTKAGEEQRRRYVKSCQLALSGGSTLPLPTERRTPSPNWAD
jgi:hypothetical protein